MSEISPPSCSPRLCHQGFLYDISSDYIGRLSTELSKPSLSSSETISLRAGIVALSDMRESISLNCQRRHTNNEDVCQVDISQIEADERLISILYVGAVLNKPISDLLFSK